MNIVLLWHMHQPDYRDESGCFLMPWVFLHGIKDYYDMPWILSRSRAKAGFNLTPILIEQLEAYIDRGPECDRFLQLWSKDSASLDAKEREGLLHIIRTAQYPTMVRPLPRFAELYDRESYSDAELTDLELCYLLAWCGPYLRTQNETVKALLAKGRGFDAADKTKLLKALFDFLPKILPLYATLQKQGRISVSTTPYTHPILPLLIDIQTAKAADPSTSLPADGFSLEEDAKLHIQKAQAIYRRLFGSDPVGMWPAEGAVDPRSAHLFQEAGVQWIATDEAILARSGDGDPYAPYDYQGIRIFFRDHTLSDLIGFSYRNLPADAAVEDFRKRLEDKRGTLFVILDGENAWEYYPDNGQPFLEGFYRMLESFETLTCDEAAKLPARTLDNLAPGSWIDGNFRTWIGDAEKNRAWELLFQTRLDVKHHGMEKDEAIRAEFLAAEASDWFWWYGEGHATEFAREFDRLYREHLIHIYERLRLPVPPDLRLPIVGTHPIHALVNEPKEPIHPVIDGRITSFFEWMGSGVIDERSGGGAMQYTSTPVERIYWGCDEAAFYFRLDSPRAADLKVRLFFDEAEITPQRIAQKEIVEIAVSKKALQKEKAEVRFEIALDGENVAILPGVARLFISRKPDYAGNWFV